MLPGLLPFSEKKKGFIYWGVVYWVFFSCRGEKKGVCLQGGDAHYGGVFLLFLQGGGLPFPP